MKQIGSVQVPQLDHGSVLWAQIQVLGQWQPVGVNMQTREINCATIEVANNRDISGRATADEMNRGLRIGKGRKLWRIACLAGLFFVLAPLRGHAQTRLTSLPYSFTTSGSTVLDGSPDYNSSSGVAIQRNTANVTGLRNGNSIDGLGAGRQ